MNIQSIFNPQKFGDYTSSDDLLKSICYDYQLPLKFIGFKNELPYIIEQGFYIVNMESKRKSSLGSHWVCILSYPSFCFYFDSFGVVPPMEVIRFIKTRHSKYYINDIEIQDYNSSACGFYCIGLSIYVKRKINTYNNDYIKCINAFINNFNHKQSRDNDYLLKQLFIRLKPISKLIWQNFLTK